MSAALQLTTAGDSAAWEDRYEELAFTAFALHTQIDDAALGKLFTEVQGVLADWERIEADRRRIRGAAIAARARVKVADSALDLILQKLAETLIAESDGQRGELYQRFFPEAHERVVALGLDGELPAASLVMAQLDEGGTVPDGLSIYIEPLRACLGLGNGALAQRADGYAELGRLAARVEAWLETADAVNRNVHADLTTLAEDRGLSARWVGSFFTR